MLRRTYTTLAIAGAAIAAVGLAANCSNDYDQFSVTSGTGASATGGTGGTTTTSTGGTGGTGGVGAQGGGGSGATGGGGSGATGGGGSGGTGATGGGGSGATGGSGGSGGSGGGGICGDAALGAGEGCDDGNTANNDGCADTCDLEGAAGDLCPTGYDIDLAPPGIWISDTTTGKNTGNNTSCGGNSAPDLVFRFVPSQTATVNVDLTGGFNKVLAIRNTCTNGAGTYCQNSPNALSTSFQATQGQAFHVVVSGQGGANGPFTLHVYY